MQLFLKKQNFILYSLIFLFFIQKNQAFAISKVEDIKTYIKIPENQLKINNVRKNRATFVKVNEKIIVKVGGKKYKGKVVSINQDYNDYIVLENNSKNEKVFLNEISYIRKAGIGEILYYMWNFFKVIGGFFLSLMGTSLAFAFPIIAIFTFGTSTNLIIFATIVFIGMAVGGYYLAKNGIEVLRNKNLYKNNFTLEIVQK